jgi:hypothetical protein
MKVALPAVLDLDPAGNAILQSRLARRLLANPGGAA